MNFQTGLKVLDKYNSEFGTGTITAVLKTRIKVVFGHEEVTYDNAMARLSLIEDKPMIKIQVDYVEKTVYKSDYIKAKTSSLVEYGYCNLSEDTVASELEKVLNGDDELDVIGMFIKGDIVT